MQTEIKQYVAYTRVSTKQQGVSGLGLENQINIINQYAQNKQGIIISHYTENVTGTKAEIKQKELTKALECAKKNGAVLVVATLDRLSRSASFLMALQDSKISFEVVDMPNLTTLTLGIYATMAQYEAEQIKKRVKDAIKTQKERLLLKSSDEQQAHKDFKIQQGKYFGNNGCYGRAAMIENANTNPNTLHAHGYAVLLKKAGNTLLQIAQTLNRDGFRTPKGCEFTPMQVKRLVEKKDLKI